MFVAPKRTQYKQEVEGRNIEQVSSFKYLGAILTSHGDLQQELKQQTMKASQIAGCTLPQRVKQKSIRQVYSDIRSGYKSGYNQNTANDEMTGKSYMTKSNAKNCDNSVKYQPQQDGQEKEEKCGTNTWTE